MKRAMIRAALLLAGTAGLAAAPDPFAGTVARDGLVPVHLDAARGRILLTLPAPNAEGVAGRFLYATALRTGIGSAAVGLDHGQQGPTRILVFRRIGGKVAAEYENPRFRASGGSVAEQRAARDSFAITTAWAGPVAATLPDGRIVVDVADLVSRDVMGVADALKRGGAGIYKLSQPLGLVDVNATRVFPDNIELEARQSFTTDDPGPEIENIAPDPKLISVTVRHSLIRLPDTSGYVPRRFDPRMGGFGTQTLDYAAPLGADVVQDYAERFRLEKTDPAAARSTVRKPIVFHIDPAAPEPIRRALADGVGWWAKAFEAAGYVDAFRVAILPEGADPLDVRYNVVNWVNRATRGWSYGQTIADPRTGEIVKGSVLLGSLRVRQDMLIYEALVGADKVGTGGPNDPVRVALARIRQLGAHEVGHALGLEHNFAASTQGRASVMDYPAPRIGLANGAPDLSDAYGTGVGAWDLAVIDWLYGAPPPGGDPEAAAWAKAAAVQARGLRFASDGDARAGDTAQPWASLWDDGADPAAELRRMLDVRAAAVARFGPAALRPGEQAINLKRKFVPVWLLHRYQVEAAAKLIGGVDFAYAVAGDGRGRSAPVPAATQAAAIDAVMAALAPPVLTVPPALLPVLSAGRSGPDDRQYDIEVMQTAGGPVFDPLVAADVAASVALEPLLAPARLARLANQHGVEAALPGVAAVSDRLVGYAAGARGDVAQRAAWRALMLMARAARDPATAPGVAATLDDALVRAGAALAKGDGWGRATARLLADEDRLKAVLAEQRNKAPKVPPGMPIGGGETEWMDGV